MDIIKEIIKPSQKLRQKSQPSISANTSTLQYRIALSRSPDFERNRIINAVAKATIKILVSILLLILIQTLFLCQRKGA